MKPLITIAMPVYNVEKYVERSLLSALGQTYENIEILVVDDKGTDNSMDIVIKLIETHPKGSIVKIIDHIVNQGTGATKNSAIKYANGAYLFFMDSDDYISKNAIEELYNASQKSNADMTIGSFIQVNQFGVQTGSRILKNEIKEGEDAFSQFYNSPYFYVETWNKLYKTEVLRKNNVHCIPSNRNEDVYFSFQLFKTIKSIATIDSVTYHYMVGDVNAATFNLRNGMISECQIEEHINILNTIYNDLKLNSEDSQYPVMLKFLIKKKAWIIREIARAKNLNTNQKELALAKLPKFDEISLKKGFPLVSYTDRLYISMNPLTIYKIRKSIPVVFARKLKNYIFRNR